MELNFREFYQEYGYGDHYGQQQQQGWRPGPWSGAAGGAYVGYALSGGNPLGAVAGGVAGYGLGRMLGHKRTEPNPRAFTYYRGEDGKVYRHLPSAPHDDEERTPEEYEALNADPSHPYIWTQGHNGKWHASKRGSQRYGYGQPHNQPYKNR